MKQEIATAESIDMQSNDQVRNAVIYARVSTGEQNCDRQERDLLAYAARHGYNVVAIYRETASGAKNNRPERKQIIDMAQRGEINAVLITELSRWGRSTTDLIQTVTQLASWGVSLLAANGSSFDVTTASGKAMLGMLAVMSEFERDMLRERVRSGLATAKAKGKISGRRQGDCPSNAKADQVMAMTAEGKTVRAIAAELELSPTTVIAIKKRCASAVPAIPTPAARLVLTMANLVHELHDELIDEMAG